MATGNKRYYWLKLKEDFFTSKRIKKLRRLAGGDTYTIIYLEIQLKAMQSGGIIRWTGIEDNFAAELALDLDEDEDNVKFTLAYLLKYGLAESSDNINFLFPYAVENVGSEGSSAKRMREMRKKMSEKCLPQPENQQGSVTLCAHCYGEKDVEIDREVDTEIDNSFKATLSDCCSKIMKNCGNHISDIDVYRGAVRYYFPNAEVHFTMTIDASGDMPTPEEMAKPAPKTETTERKATKAERVPKGSAKPAKQDKPKVAEQEKKKPAAQAPVAPEKKPVPKPKKESKPKNPAKDDGLIQLSLF